MKAFHFLPVLLLLGACQARRSAQIQVEMVSAKLIRIDTVFRNPNYMQQLTWQSPDEVMFVSFDNLAQRYTVGSRMTVFVQR